MKEKIMIAVGVGGVVLAALWYYSRQTGATVTQTAQNAVSPVTSPISSLLGNLGITNPFAATSSAAETADSTPLSSLLSSIGMSGEGLGAAPVSLAPAPAAIGANGLGGGSFSLPSLNFGDES
ncbi:MAG TPA: hypothetical protein VGG48_19070 [Rhizomicrobium sp.]|jgi:hypothetical protein